MPFPPACRTTTRCSATAPTSPICASGSRSRTRPRSRADPSSSVFAGAEAVRLLRVPQQLSRAELGRAGGGREGVGREGARLRRLDEAGEPRSPIAKFLSEAELDAFRAPPARPCCSPRPTRRDVCARVLGNLRLRSGRGARSRRRERLRVDLDRRLPDVRLVGGRTALARRTTTPSRVPLPSGRSCSTRSPRAAKSSQYDLVGNGNELGGGSFRIHAGSLQERGLRRASGCRPRSSDAKFGFLLDALAMGAPPHGGIAFGIERMLDGARARSRTCATRSRSRRTRRRRPDERRPLRRASRSELDELGIRLLEPRKP